IAVTGNGSLAASYSTSPTSSLSCSRVRSALSSSGVRVMAAAWSRSCSLCNSGPVLCTTCTPEGPVMDELDGRLIELFASDPRVGVLEASRRLGVARGTVQARLDKLATSGVITGWGPDLSPGALGFPVTAFLTLEIRQETSRGGHDVVGSHLAAIPEVLEAHTITGAGDMWAR